MHDLLSLSNTLPISSSSYSHSITTKKSIRIFIANWWLFKDIIRIYGFNTFSLFYSSYMLLPLSKLTKDYSVLNNLISCKYHISTCSPFWVYPMTLHYNHIDQKSWSEEPLMFYISFPPQKHHYFLLMVTWSMNYTLSPFSSGSSSLRNSRLGYGIWQPAKTLEQKNTVELHQYMLAYNLTFI